MERPNWSDPILPSPGQPVHPPYAIGPEVTIIPTAGVSVPYNNAYGARQYMSFMSIRSWDTPGRWTTNYSGIAYSDDNGQTWRIELQTWRDRQRCYGRLVFVEPTGRRWTDVVERLSGSTPNEMGTVFAASSIVGPEGMAGSAAAA